MTITRDSLQAIMDRGALRKPFTIPATIALATGAYITVDTGIPNSQWLVRRLRLKQETGTAVTWNVRIGGSVTFADVDAYIQLRGTDTELSTTTPINESIEQDDGWVVADANGRIYLKLTFGSATDHVVSGSGLLEPVGTIIDAP